ncbi:PD-(D/E)XK nuclease family protein [Propionivibrio sp.]|uniref:PD-(D/E)XK nuclease family protein n=1 Tax=Propionivibrio sp. TaxID=2212460 RepID=UPI00261660D8|nr:PD-(D/E)XK nuclease family protein [Propionivibrio sp.]
MQSVAEGLNSTAVPAGEGFFDALAAAIFERCSAAVEEGDLSSMLVLVPAMPLAGELLSALRRAAPRSLLLPRFDTLSHWVASTPIAAIAPPLPDSERLVLLHEALRERGWFDETALWGIATEMAGLFDELTAAAVSLPVDEAALALQLQRAYALRACAPLAFEARVVHELWRALTRAGRLDLPATYRLRLAALANRNRQAGPGHAAQPLLVLLNAAPEESLNPAERDFLLCYGAVQPLLVFHPAPRAACTSPLLATLAAAWPESAAAFAEPLFTRAMELRRHESPSPLSGRLQLVAADGREQEAQAAVAQIGAWLDSGLRRIVLIAQDRLTARRVRALLEREGVLVSDETGWKLSTSRAAAAVDALIETAAGGAYYRDLLDLCKSPCIFSDCDDDARKAAVFMLEAALRAASVKSGVPRMRRAVLDFGGQRGASQTLALTLLERIETATTLLHARPAALARWIDRLHKALEVLGAIVPLSQDAAGKVLLDLLDVRRAELAANTALFSFAAWRDWLNRQFEAANFRDGTISSTIVITPLSAVCLRRFEAALLLGGDARQLTLAATGEFFNQSVRRELGLRTRADAERELRRHLELLLATVPRVTVTWQSMQDGEANLLAPEFALLSTLHQLAWQDDLRRPPLPARAESTPENVTAPRATAFAAPVALPALIPRRVSVSGYVSLVDCPYRFFARYVLGLGEMDEVSEGMDKSDYGALVHRVLERFHERHPVVSELAADEALSALQDCVGEVFAAAVEDNFLATGWRLRWGKRMTAYLEWQRSVEAQGWRWAQAETRVSRVLPLDAGGSVELYGRIDRIDQSPAGGASLLDYKAQTAKAIRDRLADDVQLPAYALLHGNAIQAAYVALDDERITAVAAGNAVIANESLMDQAQAQGQRLVAAFNALWAGASLPAHGVDSVCQWCEMSGLCRRDHV